MLRCCWVLVGLLLSPAVVADETASEVPVGDMLSPSFTWGEIPDATGAAGLAGVYHRAAIVTELDPVLRRYVTRTRHTYWCFFPDGRCYYSMPTEGLDNFSYDYVKAMNPLWCCTYKRKGDSGLITWGTGGTTVPFHRAGEGLAIKADADVYELLDPCDDLRLEGTYRRDNWREDNAFKLGITFSPDGAFVDEGFLAGAIATWWWADRGLAEAQFPPGSGTYHVTRNSLVLLYADGRKVRANFHLADQATREDVTGFVIGARLFVRTD